ncbi:flagellar hook-associated protein FlgK [Roseateles violae]|uniref:Flagellar hook-associated protein 1 n=1 Tax=Roseateles violae TaxID=3058042 RepID=A0ABT8DTV1_9BURK|nr:flagellar hook-associated protein FlgK [Pelomonas sp. PFR6]MDN3921548.1 flagellar hook-associated protein FlgK [Pelomonas sp. PFR6]
MSMINNALSGAQASQAALSTASQNIANVMTPGYSRQGVLLNSRQTNASGAGSGAGVTVTALMRFNDSFKNMQMWSAASNLGKANAPQAYLDQLEQVMSDDTSNVNKGMDVFFAALNAASVQPDSRPLREQVLIAADGLAKRFNSLQTLLKNQIEAVGDQRNSVLLKVNTLSSEIAALNAKISAAQAIGVPPAGLMDARDQRIDSLAGLVGLQVTNQADGSCNVSFKNGQPLVIGNESATLTQVGSGTPGVHTLQLDFASARFNVAGEDLGGELGGLDDFERQCLIPTQQTVFELAKGIANNFNTTLGAGVAPVPSPAGNALFIAPTKPGESLQLTALKADELAFAASGQGVGDSQNLAALIALKDQKLTFTDFDAKGNALATTSSVLMSDAYTQMVGKVGTVSQLNIGAQKTAQTVRDQADASWKSTSGVNTDEEATNLIQYQQMYQANMKVISVANQLFDATLAAI